MVTRPTTLERLKVDGAEWLPAHSVLHVYTPHALIQVSGYLKHIHGRKSLSVYYRGQTRIYDQMLPSLYRWHSPLHYKGKSRRDVQINEYLETVKAAEGFIRGTHEYALEPILQHYGARTRWLDVVDNIWVGLWFGCYEAKIAGKLSQYINYERRSLIPDQFAYVVLLGLPNLQTVAGSPGFFRGDDVFAIDLRVAAPSLYIRPHAQHGLLFRRIRTDSYDLMDLSQFIVGTIRIGLADALAWLGSGELLSAHTLFPPPAYDHGYRALLDRSPIGNRAVGTISYVGA